MFDPTSPPLVRRLYVELERRQIVLRTLQAEMRRIRDEAGQKAAEIQFADRAVQESYRDLREVQSKWVTVTEVARRLKQMGRPQEPREMVVYQSIERQLHELCRAMQVRPDDVLRRV